MFLHALVLEIDLKVTIFIEFPEIQFTEHQTHKCLLVSNFIFIPHHPLRPTARWKNSLEMVNHPVHKSGQSHPNARQFIVDFMKKVFIPFSSIRSLHPCLRVRLQPGQTCFHPVLIYPVTASLPSPHPDFPRVCGTVCGAAAFRRSARAVLGEKIAFFPMISRRGAPFTSFFVHHADVSLFIENLPFSELKYLQRAAKRTGAASS
ncbi:MAG: hypothetical protein PHI97_21075 [Desulfobulbus sp.]|nr:hypothetical protein [Desulfobulbus sp.]